LFSCQSRVDEMVLLARLITAVLALGAFFWAGADGKLGPMDPRLDAVMGVRSLYCEGSVRILLDGAAAQTFVTVADKGVTMQEANKSANKAILFKGSKGDNPEGYDVVLSGAELTNGLQAIYLEDSCTLDAVGVSLESLHLMSNTKGDVKLRGTYKAGSIEQKKSNVIDAYWIDSDWLSLESYTGRMMLSGVADKVRVHVMGDAFVSLDTLRAKHVWISGHDSSFVRFLGRDADVSSFLDGHAHAESIGFPEYVSDISYAYATLVYHLPAADEPPLRAQEAPIKGEHLLYK
jgi:hypothetical protein